MKTNHATVTVEATVSLPVDKIWEYWTNPAHITQWNYAIDEWHCPTAENDVQPSGRFNWRMEAKDGSMGFDYTGVYKQVTENKLLVYTLDDGREVHVHFEKMNDQTKITEVFEVEDLNTKDQQQFGWQSILNNFKKYAESIA